MSRYVGMVALVALLALGCSDEHAGGLPPTTSPTATSTTPSATASASLSPSAMIEAAARAYYLELTHAGSTGRTNTLRAMVGAGCECEKTLEYLRDEVRQGHHFTTVYRVDSVRTHDVTAAAGFATVTISYRASTVVDAQGRVVRKITGKTEVGRDLGFRREGDRWLLTRLVLLDG
jgi:hypothetical protein